VSWERWTEAAVQNGGFWLAHLNYVAFWVLLALSAGLLALRLALQAVVLRRPRFASPTRAGLPPTALAVALVPLCAGSGYMALRPDPTFYTTIGGAAFEAGNCRDAVIYYAPLADWGSRDVQVLERFAVCEIQLGRYESGVRRMSAARALNGARSPLLRQFYARALVATGRPEEAARELEAALAALPPGPARAPLELELELVRAAAHGERR
jgi:hypothetical protein